MGKMQGLNGLNERFELVKCKVWIGYMKGLNG